ncbi:hypothetical protein CTO_0966 [Chlamydia trachomatis A2497]|uniref:Uncharacterized protein n=1 Tax=Chlamydia trachomatis serovar A (strain A2497) TaxID=580047 RepID=G4NMC9_CHLT4|nr:hypothetical protein CTO_0966 [Chlamydia trachomatis A2497]AGT70423.1 hypothetical protein O177_01535 [Chlamydia trachomatis]AGT73195.1 hypothetical protein O180_01545 [Chlamydia trachomatis]AHC17751.1 hypothetical protein CTW3_01540 [Chlamydia trachomatis C/TW-3]AKR33065.1 hypothetical protein DCS63711_01530 [Chlamydia trachomatis D/CS637/11]
MPDSKKASKNLKKVCYKKCFNLPIPFPLRKVASLS